MITREQIEEAMKDFSKGLPHIVHNEWEEDGERYSAWTINGPGFSMTTGDGGIKLYNEALKKELSKGYEGNKDI